MFHRSVAGCGLELVVVGALLVVSCVDEATKDDATLTNEDREAGGVVSPQDGDGSIALTADGGPDSSESYSSQDNLTLVLEETSEDTSLDVTLGTIGDAGESSRDAHVEATETEASVTELDSSTAVAVDAKDGGVDAAADAGAVGCDGREITSGSHLFFEFDALNGEWVTSLFWQDSTATLTGNIAGYAGGPGCSAPNEFFGQAFAAPEGNAPYPVGANNLTSAVSCGLDRFIDALPLDCTDTSQVPVTTSYHFYAGAKADQVRITRTIGFDSQTPISTGAGMRVYSPRPTLNALPDVIVPNGNTDSPGVAVGSALSCADDCFTAVGDDWNGQWFADANFSTGLAMIVLRDPSMANPVALTVNNDAASSTNVSAFVALQPTEGWKQPLTETIYLCFADLTTWPQADRDAAVLPEFCGP